MSSSQEILNSSSDDELGLLQWASKHDSRPLRRAIHLMQKRLASSSSRQEPISAKSTFVRLFREADRRDKALFIISTFISSASSLAPLFTVFIISETIQTMEPEHQLLEQERGGKPSGRFRDHITSLMYLAFCVLFLAYLARTGFLILARNITGNIRVNYLRSFLYQDMEWIDSCHFHDLRIKYTQQLEQIQDGIGRKACNFVFLFSGFTFGITMGLFKGLELSLAAFLVVPISCCAIFYFYKSIASSPQSSTFGGETKANEVARGTLEQIKAVHETNGQRHREEDYAARLQEGQEAAIERESDFGLAIGMIHLTAFLIMAICLYSGNIFVQHNRRNVILGRNYQISDVFCISMLLAISTFLLGLAIETFRLIHDALKVTGTIYSSIDSCEENQDIVYTYDTTHRLGEVDGSVEFTNVEFSYPSKPDINILEDFNLSISAGSLSAVLAPDRAGKSTLIELIEKFYEPQRGSMTLSHKDLALIDPLVLRKKIAVVRQEPVLFATSIMSNIKMANPQASYQAVMDATKRALVHTTIMSLPDHYDTDVRSEDIDLTVGQKQLIVLARELLKEPALIVYDDCTRCADRDSECDFLQIQKSLRGQVTQLVLTSQTNDLEDMDQIAVLRQKRICEVGTHEQLLNSRGVYAGMFVYKTLSTENSILPISTDDTTREQNCSFRFSDRITEDYTTSLLNEDPELYRVSDSYMVYSDDEENQELLTEGSSKSSSQLLASGLKISMLHCFYEVLKPDFHILLAGCSAAFAKGVIFPFLGFTVAQYIHSVQLLESEDTNHKALNADIRGFCGVLAAGGAALCLAYYFQTRYLSMAAENVLTRVRRLTFHRLLKIPVSKLEENSEHALKMSYLLEKDCKQMMLFINPVLGMWCQSAAALLASISFAYCINWCMGTFFLIIAPLNILATLKSSNEVLSRQGKAPIQNDSEETTEILKSARTLKALGAERSVLRLYGQRILTNGRESRSSAHLEGLVFSLTQAIPQLVFLLSFFVASEIIKRGSEDFYSVWAALLTVTYGGWFAASTMIFAPNTEKARESARVIFETIESHLETPMEANSSNSRDYISGDVEFINVHFSYPGSDKPALKGVSFRIAERQTLALVGPAGSGKSTIIQMMMGFYEPSMGQILFDGRDRSSFDVRYLRSKVTFLSKEPILFEGSILQNLHYGKQNATLEELRDACFQAKILNFDTDKEFDQELHSDAGDLRPAQKHRLAIARSILKGPKIVLLDDVTAGVENVEIPIVEAALDNLKYGRTCVIISSDPTNICECDRVCILQDGFVTRQGSFERISAGHDSFYNLVYARTSGDRNKPTPRHLY